MNTLLDSGQKAAPPRSRRSRMLRRTEYLLLAVGFLCLGVYLFSIAESGLWQSYDEYRLEASIRGEKAGVLGYVWHVLSGSGGEKSATGEEDAYDALRQQPQRLPRIYRTPPPYGIIGRIEVPRLNVSAVVREGVDSKTLRRAAGHVPGTALPGDDGNVAVAAHRDTFFRGLRDVRESDRIRMVTPDGNFEYIVRSTQIVTPSDVQVLEPKDGKRELTLITCYPFNYVGHAPKRFIVKAEEATIDASTAPPKSGASLRPEAAVIPAAAAAAATQGPALRSTPRRAAAKPTRNRKARQQARSRSHREGW